MTLRIQRSEEFESVVYALIGRIQAEQVAEVQELLKSNSSGHNVVFDLTCAKLVNREAVRFLAECETRRIELKNLRRLYPGLDCVREECDASILRFNRPPPSTSLIISHSRNAIFNSLAGAVI